MLKKFKFKIFGTHCSSCKDLIETEVDTLFGVKNINVDYSSGETIVEYDSEKISKEKIFKVIKKLKYEPREIGSDFKANKLGIKKIISIGVLFILFVGAYFIVSELGLLEIMSSLNETSISLWLVLLIGFLASFHCVGMCGGLVISYSAKVQTHEKNYLSHLRYNLGRFISYSIIGGILGGFGSFFGVNPTFTGGLVLVAGVFMILLGISLFSNIRWIEKIKLKTPKFIARFLYNNKNTKKSITSKLF